MGAEMLSALGSAASGIGGIIEGVGSLLPTTTTSKGRTITDSTASSDTQSGQLNVQKGTQNTQSNTQNSNFSTASNVTKNAQNSTEKSTASTEGRTTVSGTEKFSGQDNVRSSQLMLDVPGIQRIMNTFLQGDAGIAGLQQITNGERNAGIFNSSTNEMLVNNLLTVAAGEVGRLSAPTVNKESIGATTNTTNQTTTSSVKQIADVVSALTGTSLSNSAEASRGNSQTQSNTQVEDILASLAQQLTDQSAHSDTTNSSKSKSKKFPCFITTAVVEILGFGDSCPELKTLRAYRETWLRENHPEAIALYHEVAPNLVLQMKALSMLERRSLSWTMMTQFITPAVDAIDRGDNEGALAIYKDMVTTLQSFFAPVVETDTNED